MLRFIPALLIVTLGCGRAGQASAVAQKPLASAQDVLAKCEEAYRECKQISFSGNQTVTFENLSGELETAWTSYFELKLRRPDRILCLQGEATAKGNKPLKVVMENSDGSTLIDMRSGERKTGGSPVPSIAPPPIGEGAFFVFERLWPKAAAMQSEFPSRHEMKEAKLVRREVRDGFECYVLSTECPAMMKWEGGTATIWISTKDYMVLRVLVEGTAGPGKPRATTRDTVFRYVSTPKLQESDFHWSPPKSD